jgi:hypothetical protein
MLHVVGPFYLIGAGLEVAPVCGTSADLAEARGSFGPARTNVPRNPDGCYIFVALIAQRPGGTGLPRHRPVNRGQTEPLVHRDDRVGDPRLDAKLRIG